MSIDTTPNTNSVSSKHSSSEDLKHSFEGLHLRFPTYKHNHPPVIDVNQATDKQMTIGNRISDLVASSVGSWPFIITQSILLLVWIVANVIFLTVARPLAWDPYPFILLNLALSFQAAYAAPFVMMSQNRQAEKDRLTAQNDYETDVKSEQEIRHIMEHLDHQDTLILQLVQQIEAQNESLELQHQTILKHLNKLASTIAEEL